MQNAAAVSWIAMVVINGPPAGGAGSLPMVEGGKGAGASAAGRLARTGHGCERVSFLWSAALLARAWSLHKPTICE